MKNLAHPIYSVLRKGQGNICSYIFNHRAVDVKVFLIPNNQGIVIRPVGLTEEEFQVIGTEISEKILSAYESQGIDIGSVNAFFHRKPDMMELFIRQVQGDS